MDSDDRRLPDFRRPPVTETVLDVGFSPLSGWGIPHFGLFWNSIRAEYPTFQVQPPIMLQRENLGSTPPSGLTLAFELLNQPEARCWFVERSEARLIQVQHDRFIHNWRKTDNETEYPHYEKVIRPAFSREWTRFCDFLQQEKIELPQVQQCEVQYINHVDYSNWQSFTDLVQPLDAWPGGRGFLPLPETISCVTSYLMPEGAGRLRITLQPAIRNSDGKRVLQLTLMVRGQPKSSETDDILKWFDIGREWIVNGFTEFTSAKMHAVWERIS
jgi:uncharacterized protein (TIGR04255 family)